MRIAFIGLGVMGSPIAGHLAAAGHEMAVFNRTPNKAQLWLQSHPGRLARSPGDAAVDSDFVVLCVGNDDDVRDVVTQMLASLSPGAVIVDHTTTSGQLAREMNRAVRERGCDFLDAPVSGGESGAVNGQLSVMVGGDASAFTKAEAIVRAYGKAVARMGASGSGQLTKMVNQICIAGVVQGLSEAVAFAGHAGLNTDAVYAAISNGAAQSWQMDNRWKSMAEGKFDFGFAVDWMRKDLGLVLEEARANGARVEITALVDQFYAEVQAMGGARWDTSSLAARLTKR